MRLVGVLVVCVACGGEIAGYDGGLLPSNDAAAPPESPACQVSVEKLSKACTVDEDCVLVAKGDLCASPCAGCPNDVIAQSSLAAYNAMIAQIPPSDAGPVTCHCASSPVPKCCGTTCCPF